MFQLVQSSQYKTGLKPREGRTYEAVQPDDGAAAFRHSVPRCNAEIRENKHAARKWKQDQFCIFLEQNTFPHKTYCAGVSSFMGRGKKLLFFQNPALIGLLQLVQDPRDCLGDAMAKQSGRVALAFPERGGVCAR